MKLRRALVMTAASLLLIAEIADTHHSFNAVYDPSRMISVAGVVTAFRFVNPHAMLTIEGVDERNESVTWHVEFDGRLNLSHAGWTQNTIAVGERVTVFGNPANADSRSLFFNRLLLADGTELLRPAVERVNAVEEARRTRARARNLEN